MPQRLQALRELISTTIKIVITTHHKPDADALGSSLAWARYLIKKGHEVQVIVPSDYPDFLFWMEGNDDVIIFSEETEAQCKTIINEANAIFCLDFNALGRINQLGDLVRQSSATKVLIDHHLEPDNFAAISFSDTTAASTCSIIYELIMSLEDRHLMDTYIAECLYAGIMTDTGSFRHSSTNKKVHLIVADLYTWNVNTTRIHRLIFDTNSEERLHLLGYALSEKMIYVEGYYTAYIYLTADDLKRFDSKTGDTEGLVNYALSIDKVVLAVMITEREDGVKLSFRSKGEFNVNEFARKHFNGGGHKNASGGKSNVNVNDTVKYLKSILPEYKQELLDNLRKEKFLC